MAQVLFLRCAAHLPAGRPVTLWDPCCGSGYLALLTFAGRPNGNASCGSGHTCTRDQGIWRRPRRRRFASALQDAVADLPTVAATADVFVPAELAAMPTADLEVTDLPYGEQTTWQGAAPPAAEALAVMLQSPRRVLPDHAVLALWARTRRISVDRPIPSLDRLRLGHPAAFRGRVGDMRGAW